MKKIIVSFLFLVLVISCTRQEPPIENFLNAEVQEIKERKITQNTLELVLEKELDELEIFSFLNIVEVGDKFLIPQNQNMVVTQLEKSDLTSNHSIPLKKGKGPGEVDHLMDFAATTDFIAIVDRSQSKILLMDYEGNLINEFRTENSVPHRMSIERNGTFNIMYEVGALDAEGTIPFLENVDKDGSSNYQFTRETIQGINRYAIEGQIKNFNDALYYVGYHEPFIKKYSRGELVYSKKTIDNYDTSANYMERVSGEFRMTGLSNEVIYSSNDFDVKGEKLFIIPNSNGDPDFSFIDVYDAGTGDYLESFKTIDRSINLNVYEDENSILTIEYANERFLFRKYTYNSK